RLRDHLLAFHPNTVQPEIWWCHECSMAARLTVNPSVVEKSRDGRFVASVGRIRRGGSLCRGHRLAPFEGGRPTGGGLCDLRQLRAPPPGWSRGRRLAAQRRHARPAETLLRT